MSRTPSTVMASGPTARRSAEPPTEPRSSPHPRGPTRPGGRNRRSLIGPTPSHSGLDCDVSGWSVGIHARTLPQSRSDRLRMDTNLTRPRRSGPGAPPYEARQPSPLDAGRRIRMPAPWGAGILVAVRRRLTLLRGAPGPATFDTSPQIRPAVPLPRDRLRCTATHRPICTPKSISSGSNASGDRSAEPNGSDLVGTPRW